MRNLTERELDLIAGGATDTITVIGDPLDPPIWYPDPGPGPGFVPPHYYEGGGGGGGATGGEDPIDCTDRSAFDAEDLIKDRPDDNSREFGSVLYRGADGKVHNSPLFEGQVRNTSNGPISYIDPTDVRAWLANNNIPISAVVGFVHNHDLQHYGQTSEAARINRYPSVNDWGFADNLIRDGADASKLSLYVIDPDGKMREFEYDEAARYRGLEDSQKNEARNLPDEMVDDGSSCP
jgi:hypothetical protein